MTLGSHRRYVALVAVLGLVVLASTHTLIRFVGSGVSADLTADRVYTLHHGTRDIVRALGEPITLTLFYSADVGDADPSLALHTGRVRTLLEEISLLAPDRIDLQLISVTPFSAEEDQAIAAGMFSVARADGTPFYLGLSGRNLIDETGAIPFFPTARSDLLEFEIARLISELDEPPTERVTLIPGIELETYEGPRFFFSEMRRGYDVQLLEPDFAALPRDPGVLILIHPTGYTDNQWRLVDQHLEGGGRALVLIDPFSRLAAAPAVRGLPPDLEAAPSDAEPLRKRLGVGLRRGEVVLDGTAGLPVDVEIEGRVVERVYPVWFRIEPSQMNAANAVVGPLANGIHVAAAGALEIDTDAEGVTHTLLMTSGRDSWLVPVAAIADDPLPSELSATRPQNEEETAPQTLAVMADGPAGNGANWRAIVIADTDFLDDAFYLAPTESGEPGLAADNAALFMNAVDILSGNAALVELRALQRRERRLTRIERLQAQTEARLQAEEERLRAEFDAARSRLEAARAGRFGIGDSALSREEREAGLRLEIEAAQNAVSETRERLRAVERDFRRDVDRFALIANVLSVWLIPVLMLIGGVAVPLWRERRGGAH